MVNCNGFTPGGRLHGSSGIAELKRREIPVSTPFGDNERYDVVVETPEQALLRVQIKTGWLDDGLVEFNGKSQHTNSQGNTYKQYNGDVDWFLVYCHELETLYPIDEDEFVSRMTLRTGEPRRVDSTINWAQDYEFDERWPPEQEPADETNTDRAAVREAIDGLRITGARVLRAVGEEDPRNLTVETSSAIYRTRVEKSWITEGRVRFSADADEVDCYVVYCEGNDTLYAVDDRACEQSISLRVDAVEHDRETINWASEYELERNWPPGQRQRVRPPSLRAAVNLVPPRSVLPIDTSR